MNVDTYFYPVMLGLDLTIYLFCFYLSYKVVIKSYQLLFTPHKGIASGSFHLMILK